MRRVFLQMNEVLPLLVGVARGDPVALRRVLGARRAGRIGLAIGLAGLLLAVPRSAWPLLVALQLVAGLPGAALARPRLGFLQYQRLSLWIAGSALLAAAPLRAAGIPALAVSSALWFAAHLLLWRHLRRGLEGPA